MNYREATAADLTAIKTLLNSSKLPSDDCDEHIGNFIVAEDRGKIIGTGGLEICGADGLLRSIVITPEHRGNGIAKKIYQQIEDRAYSLDVSTLYLLTESATEYFKKLGFVIKKRSETPKSIMQTKQFRELCPSSATVMCRTDTRPHSVEASK
ncbi:MAG: arsenic resistance N-acetyltransferase ArsN2 [Gammaproteobacteria bacterium]|nr:arsenic resistance N-acetyltransferase ArsN2 [Gammaproteobacteria bacterium]MCF6260895.1 arsenic resistance N-acetyltransferase ArsN2 [Gammaproteobacteria bacterium]